MSKERELLERLLSNWKQPHAGRFSDLFDEVRALLSTPEPERRRMSKAEDLLVRAGLVIAQYRWKNTEDLAPHEVSQQIYKYFEENQKEGLVVSSKMERPFIRLTDEEIKEIVGLYSTAIGGYTRKLFDEIQDKLEEKNK